MAIEYDFYPVNELNQTKGKWRARAVHKRTISTDKLANCMQKTSNITSPEAKGFLSILTDSMMDFLKEGYIVQVGDPGYFSVSPTSPLID